MKEWYHPDKVTKKGQRLLHNHPEGMILYYECLKSFAVAFKMLSEKAQLFGHTLTKVGVICVITMVIITIATSPTVSLS